MNIDLWSYSEPVAEHLFEDNNASKRICSIKKTHGAQKGANILTDKFRQCADSGEDAEKEDEQSFEDAVFRLERVNRNQEKIICEYKRVERRRQKRKKALIMGFCFFLLSIFLIGLFEWILGRKNLSDVWRKIAEYIPLFVEMIPVVFKMPKILQCVRVRGEQEGIGEGMLEWVKNFLHQFSKASGQHILIITIIVTLLSQRIAHHHPIEQLRIFFNGGFVALADSDNNYDNKNGTDDVQDVGRELVEATISAEMKQYLTESDNVLIEQLDKAIVTNAQRGMVMNLSEEDNYRLFCWGEDQTQEQLNESVGSMVAECCDQQLDNVFDRESYQGGAPQDIKNLISQVSKDESSWNNFSDIEDRLDLRENVVSTYPKRTLMQLVANDYQWMALLMVWHGGKQNTIIYYYGQSILYDFECLKFAENTDRLIKKRLKIIAQRYEDIAYVCPNFEWAEEARRLAVAFRYAADQY